VHFIGQGTAVRAKHVVVLLGHQLEHGESDALERFHGVPGRGQDHLIDQLEVFGRQVLGPGQVGSCPDHLGEVDKKRALDVSLLGRF